MIGGWGRQLKKQGKDCVQPWWPESNIPELMAKVKANKIQRCSTVARNMRAHVPNATKATCFTMKFLQNTSLAAPGALAHRLQRRTACNSSTGPARAMRVEYPASDIVYTLSLLSRL